MLCSYTIFLAQTLLIRLWPKAQSTINICRGWVKELSLSELGRINEEKTPKQYYLGHCNSQGSDRGV